MRNIVEPEKLHFRIKREMITEINEIKENI
jgi:hypothetical protein